MGIFQSPKYVVSVDILVQIVQSVDLLGVPGKEDEAVVQVPVARPKAHAEQVRRFHVALDRGMFQYKIVSQWGCFSTKYSVRQ